MTEKEADKVMDGLSRLARMATGGRTEDRPGFKTSELQLAAAAAAFIGFAAEAGVQFTDKQMMLLAGLAGLYVLCRSAVKIARILKARPPV